MASSVFDAKSLKEKDGLVKAAEWIFTNNVSAENPHISNLGTVRVFRQRFALEDAIEFHAFAPLEALPCV